MFNVCLGVSLFASLFYYFIFSGWSKSMTTLLFPFFSTILLCVFFILFSSFKYLYNIHVYESVCFFYECVCLFIYLFICFCIFSSFVYYLSFLKFYYLSSKPYQRIHLDIFGGFGIHNNFFVTVSVVDFEFLENRMLIAE